MSKRLNIGLLVDNIDAVFTNEACKGAVLGAQAIDANMYVFPGGYLDPVDISDAHFKYEYQYNTIFSFAHNKKLDVLYIMMGMIGGRVPMEARLTFLKQYLDIPVVALYTRMEGYPAVTFNNRIGFEDAIRHLITEHHVTKLGYISGPKTNVDAMERLDTFRRVLTDEHIPIDENLIIYGNFEESSEVWIKDLVKQHPELEALVFANDRMALGGYHALQDLGLRVGIDLLVVSFDNSSFAATITPPLSTVEANAAELTYRAIVNSIDFLKTGKMEDMEIETHFVRRSSCGCHQFDTKSMTKLLGFDDTTKAESLDLAPINRYLFGNYMQNDTLMLIEDNLAVLVKMLFEMADNRDFEFYQKDLKIVFSQIISMPLLQYTTVELLFNFLMYTHQSLSDRIPDINDKLHFTAFFSQMYRDLAISNCQVVQQQQEGLDRISHLMNNMNMGMLLMEKESSIPYAAALKNLDTIGIHSAYLYTYQDIIHHPRENAWIRPNKMLFRAYYNKTGVYDTPDAQQLISTDELFDNPYIPKDRRVTMVLSPLFSGADLFGLLLSEVDYKDFGNIATISFQLSAILKSLLLLEKQQAIQKEMEKNLLQIKESNQQLDVISKSDELTGLYNRRGFLEYSRNAIHNPRNASKRAMIIYADMDNLKMINDNFGHDEGDFALKEIASILQDAFRNTDIIGRFGGDEFTVFALTDVEDYENIIRRRIDEITRRHNKTCQKPYPIEMSMGIHEFECTAGVEIYKLLDIADELLYREKRQKKGIR